MRSTTTTAHLNEISFCVTLPKFSQNVYFPVSTYLTFWATYQTFLAVSFVFFHTHPFPLSLFLLPLSFFSLLAAPNSLTWPATLPVAPWWPGLLTLAAYLVKRKNGALRRCVPLVTLATFSAQPLLPTTSLLTDCLPGEGAQRWQRVGEEKGARWRNKGKWQW